MNKIILYQLPIINPSKFYLFITKLIIQKMQMINGSYSPSLYFKISSITLAVVLVAIYWISQYYHHQKPFPAASISNTSNHFPQYVLFRTACISGPVLFVLGWMSNYFYLKTIALQKVINIHKLKPQILTSIGIIASIMLMFSTAFIDTASQHHHWHMKCAQLFFLLTFIAQIYNTFVFTYLSYKYNAVNKLLVYCKLFVAFLLFLQIYFSLKTGLIFGNSENEQSDINNLQGSNFLQWTTSFTISLGYYIMGLDVDEFKYVYEKYDKINQSNSNIELTNN